MPKALGLDAVEDDCSSAWGYDSDAYGPRVIIQDYDSSNDRQLWTLTDGGEFESVACSGKLLTREDDDAEECTAGSRLILRTSDGSVTQSWKIGADQAIAMDVDCEQYYLPSLVISEIEDDDIDTMHENRAYVSIINEASEMALSVASVCDTTSTQLDKTTMSKHIAMIQSKLNEAVHHARTNVETKSRRLTEAGTTATDSPTSSPTEKPTTSPTKSPTSSPTQSPTEIPRVELQDYDETDPTQQFVLIKGSDDYYWIFSPYCSSDTVIKILMVPKGGSNGAGQLAELQDVDLTNWAGKLLMNFYGWFIVCFVAA